MNKLLALLFWLILFCNSAEVYCQRVSFLFISKQGGNTKEHQVTSNGFNSMFLVDAIAAFEKDFPCALVRDPQSAKLCIEELRLQGTPPFGSQNVAPKIRNIVNAMKNSEYRVFYSIYPITDDVAQAKVKLVDRKGKVLMDISYTLTLKELLGPGTIDPVKKLLEVLKKLEICPYTGSLNITVDSKRDEESSAVKPAPCGEGTVSTTSTVKSNSTISWELNKIGKRMTSGTVKYNLSEEYKTVDDYSCFKCKGGVEGALKITDTRNSQVKVSGLSNKSISKGKKIDDARIQIVFKDDGTYMILVKATSQKGTLIQTSERKAEGACQSENKPLDTQNKSIDVPLKGVFGPYTGTALDKVLYQKETKDVSEGKEKSTITIEFSLTRD
jgi:hypothetical protein